MDRISYYILTYVLLGTLLFFKYTMFIKDICHNTCTNNHDTIDVYASFIWQSSCSK